MAKKKLRVSICTDEHLSPDVAEIFRQRLRTIEAARHAEFRGRDERDYIGTLYARNIVFATSDEIFAKELYEKGIRHAGIIYIPAKMIESEKQLFAQIAAAYVHGECRNSPFAFRGCALYPGHDGVRLIKPHSNSELAFSWDWLYDAAERQ